MASAGGFAAALAGVAANASDAVVDMTEVGFLDANGVAALVKARRLFEILGLSVTVRAPSPWARWILDPCHFDDRLDHRGVRSETRGGWGR